jgi:hypothetical protein
MSEWHPGIPEEYRNAIVTGDARVLAERIPDESVDMVVSDPVYQNIEDYAWLAETSARVLKPGGDVLVYLAMYHMAPIMAAMSEHLTFRWLLAEKKLTAGTLIWSYSLFNHYIPVLWFTKGSPRKGPHRMDFMWSQSEGGAVNHKWSKGAYRTAYWLRRFGQVADIVLDPFCGGGAIPAACKLLQRDSIGFEIDPDTAERARQRVAETQPPLFVLSEEQAVMEALA